MKKIKLLIVMLVVLFCSTTSSYGVDHNYYLGEVQQSLSRWTGVAVTGEGRMFVTFPRANGIPCSVGEIVNGDVVPYPNLEWNNWSILSTANNQFVNTNSVQIDQNNCLWVLDSGTLLGQLIPSGAKLVKIDLNTDSVLQVIYIDTCATPSESFLNDFRIDIQRGYAYITDSGLGAIIVVNLVTGQCRRLLSEHSSVKAEDMLMVVNGQTVCWKVHVNGLALNQNGEYLYYKALCGYALYRIPTSALIDTTFHNETVEYYVQLVIFTIPCDGMEFDAHGNLYFTGIEENTIYYLTPSLQFETLITDSRLKYPDSFSITPNGDIYVSTSRTLHLPGYHHIFKVKIMPTDIADFNINEPKVELYQNYPNPFQSQTTIKYFIEKESNVTLKVFDLLGRELSVIEKGTKEPGEHEVVFDNKNLTDGFYIYTLQIGNRTLTKKMVIETLN
jgi:sugar lactone lactonase YvrE